MALLLSLEQSTLDILELFIFLLFNFSTNDFLVEKGNLIAQIISQKCEEVSFVEVETVHIVRKTDFEHLRKKKSILRVLEVLVLQVCDNFFSVKKKF